MDRSIFKYLKPAVLVLFFTSASVHLLAQPATVGLTKYDDRIMEGYFLLSTHNSTTTYLLDNCGFVVHSWPSNYFPGNTARLMPDGRLLRAAKVTSDFFNAGGAGGRIEIINWDGTMDWEFDYSSDKFRHHHDVLDMPNGNILILAWDGHTGDEAIAWGRSPDMLGEANQDVWAEHLLEIKPLANNQYEIVWEWHLWDHVIQEIDDTKLNYGVVSDHPEKIDLNYVDNAPTNPDWIHANGISYSPEYDQIIISAFRFDEFWIIDHSTTTAEAKTGTGGNAGKGGDILYRWGNPFSYGQGTAADQQLFNQHNPHWNGTNHGIIIFNNGVGRDSVHSSVDFLELPTQNSAYYLESNGTYGPAAPSRSYRSDQIEEFKFSRIISGANELENGNVFICSGVTGNIIEITKEGEVLWNYINPISSKGIVEQGFSYEDNPSSSNFVFRSYKYPLDFSGFSGHNLEASDRLELNPFTSYPCNSLVLATDKLLTENNFEIYPNPIVSGQTLGITLALNEAVPLIYLVDALGRRTPLAFSTNPGAENLQVELPALNSGVYEIVGVTSGSKISAKLIVLDN